MSTHKRITAYEIADMIRAIGFSGASGRFVGTTITGPYRQSIYEIPKKQSNESFEDVVGRANGALAKYVDSLIKPANTASIDVKVDSTNNTIDVDSDKNCYRMYITYATLLDSIIVAIAITKKE